MSKGKITNIRKIMKKYLLKISVFLSVLGFAPLFASAVEVSLKGVLVNSPSTDKVYLYEATDPSRIIEEAVVDGQGTFSLTYHPKTIGFYTLKFKNAKSALCVLKPRAVVEITIDGRTGMMLKTSGSEENLLLQDYQRQLLALDARKSNLITAHRKKENVRFQEDMMALEAERKEMVARLCDENSDNYASAALLEYLDVDQYQELYEMVLSRLMKKYSHNEFLNYKYGQLTLSRSLNPGNPAPVFSLPDTAGTNVSLSDYKGRVLLLDFWASWCSDCRRENPALVQLYRRYHEQGLEVLGISLDNDRERWMNAIRADSLTWTHVSALKSWDCPVRTAYNIRWIPALVLIDSDGKIVARALQGEALESKIKEILKIK